jgi:hypothetical protein
MTFFLIVYYSLGGLLMSLKDLQKYREYMRAYMRGRLAKKRQEALEYLGGVCKRCGSDKNLTFDHIDRASKKINISKILSRSWQEQKKELDKCQILCRKCHKEKTLEDFGQTSAKGTHGTLSSYRYCKCILCRRAKAAYMKDYKSRIH